MEASMPLAPGAVNKRPSCFGRPGGSYEVPDPQRPRVSQRAYELLKSQARSAALPDWVPARNGGQDFALVFGAVGNQDLESVRVPGFFTYAGFQRGFVEQLGDIAEQVKKERWVLGPAGEQTAGGIHRQLP